MYHLFNLNRFMIRQNLPAMGEKINTYRRYLFLFYKNPYRMMVYKIVLELQFSLDKN